MNRRELKRIMIIILVVLNGFLLLHLIRRSASARFAERRAEQELLALFAADGVALSPETIPHAKPPPVIHLDMSEETWEKFASVFLGPGAARKKSGVARRYADGDADVQFFADGRFSATGLSVEKDPETLCREFCRVWPYELPAPPKESGTVTMSARYGGFDVFNCDASFAFEKGVLREASGKILPPDGAAGDSPTLSAAGALAIFQAVRRENRVVSAEIRRVSLCYALQSADAETFSLVPVWRIETDTAPYYVNCVSGELIFS